MEKTHKIKIGFKEPIKIYGKKGVKTVTARVDTGAKRCSIDKKLAEQLGLTDIVKYKTIKSALGMTKRPVVKIKIKIKTKKLIVYCTLADRTRLKYLALIGRNVIKRGFVIEPEQK